MPVQFPFRLWMLATWLLLAGPVHAADPCPAQRGKSQAAGTAARIVAFACNEHLAWHRPFIDRNGRLASATVSEAESTRLADGIQPWRRVAAYWQESGLLAQMSRFPGANECGYAGSDASSSPACRGFVVDKPWSAAFVSWVMVSARLPGFRPSANHIGYVRNAVMQPQGSPWEVQDPATAAPGAGDLLCYVRVPGTSYGHAGLLAAVRADGGGLQMHCDIVVAANPTNDPTVYLIGGNVLQGVTMRLLPLNRAGRLWRLPTTAGVAPPCSPDNEAGCSFNRQDWALLLRPKPTAALAALPPPPPLHDRMLPAMPSARDCCVHCVVGSGVPRCPPPDAR